MVARVTPQPYGLWKHPKINREGAKNAKVREGKTNKNPPRNGPSRGSSFANLRALGAFAVNLSAVRPGRWSDGERAPVHMR